MVHSEAALAAVVASLGDFRRAESLVASALSQARLLGRRHVLMVQVRTAEMSVVSGRPGQAKEGLVEAVDILLQIGGQEWIPDSLELSAIVLAAASQPGSAARLAGAAERVREKQGGFRITHDQLARTRAEIHDALGPEGFAAEVAQGRALSPDQALRYALEHVSAL